MTHVEDERRLRRAIAELARCRIEDVESIWSMLSDAERERLRPLLADASRAAGGSEEASAVAPDAETPTQVGRLARAFAVLPVELAARLAAGLDDAERTLALAHLTDERRHVLTRCVEARAGGFRISPRAAGALRDVVLTLDAPADAAPPALASARLPLRTRLRNLVRKRR
ncbi:hypothetical protein CFB40_16025 [Burkholderia sp. AU31652]|uniref:hypothetical protein n=1 Tax=Burkholderia sp. AU31652 TaxID=2015354 RepID=UPI000B7A6E3C|nr:hypothetical protein [Burkholderia sp. AU31652]OXI87182.1 hypothetical protein CFB40_16025 [Burkholderia sp. AU31652]